MPLTNKTIESVIRSEKFQEECLSIITFASEICEMEHVIVSFIENNSTFTIAKIGIDECFSPEKIQLLNTSIIQENKRQENSDSEFYIGIPILFGQETTNGTVCFWDSKPKIVSSIQQKTINHIALQLQSTFQLHAQNLDTAQKEFYKQILDRVPTEIVAFDSEHRYLYVNPAAIRNDELREFIIGKDDFEYAIHTNRNNQFAQERRSRFLTAATTKSVIEWIDEIEKNDGTTVFHTRKFAPVFDEMGELEMMVGFGSDITALKKAEADLKISNERFSYSSQATSDALWDWNMITDEIFVGESHATLFGHEFENNTITGSACENFIHPDDKERYFKHFNEVIASNSKKWSDEYRYLKADGSYSYVSDKAIIIRNEKGTAIRMIGAMEDITDRRNVEEQNRLLIEENNQNKNIQLNEAKNMYRLLADNTVDLICLHNLDTTFEYISPSIKKLTGYTPEELIGEFPMNFVHPKDLATIQKSYGSFITEKEDDNAHVEARFKNKKGDYIWFEIKAKIVKEDGKPVSFQTSARDITQKK